MLFIFMTVAPTVTLRNKNGQSQDVGKSTVLTCTISGFPLGETFWTGPPSGRRINATGSLKYEYDVIDVSRMYSGTNHTME